MARDGGLPPLHLQLAGPAARPSGHPDHAFVLPNLAVGEYPTPEDAEWLRDACRISTVVCLQDDLDLDRKGVHPGALRSAYGRAGLSWERFPVPDGDAAALCALLDAVLERLSRLLADDQRVYLHCNAGLNRAPTVAIAYLHRHLELSLDEACAQVKARRPCVPYMRALRAHFGA